MAELRSQDPIIPRRIGMAKLFGAQRMVLQAILDAEGESSAFIEDTKVAQATQISLRDVRD